VSLERDGSNQWHWLKGGGEIDQTNVQSLLNTLSSLHAVRWLGVTTPQQGLEKPQVVVTFTDNKGSHKLAIGGGTGDGSWCARVDGREGTFAISSTDLTALKLPLVRQSTSSPSPTPSAK
jgi:hypothetical protein